VNNLPLAAATIAAITWLSSTARAQEDPCYPTDALSTCLPSDNLWVHLGGSRWFAQAPTQTAPASSAAFGFVPSYYRRPIGLRVASADPDGTTIYAVDNALSATFLMGVGVSDRAQIHVAAPVVLYQDGAGKGDITGGEDPLPRSAVGDMRFGATLGILQRAYMESGPGLALRFEMTAPTGKANAFTGFPTATYAPGLSFDYQLGGFAIGADAGVRIRDVVELAGAAVGTQVSLGIGVGYDVFDDGLLSINLEANALFGVYEQTELASQPGQFTPEPEPTGEPHIPAEWMLSVRTASLLDGRFRASLGGGSFIPTSAEITPVTTPMLRFALGIHYTFSALGEGDPKE
jgi:OOP family OmpA-OmpF porin